MLRTAMMLLIAISLGGCYYLQAARGQWQVLHGKAPIATVIEDAQTPPELARRLAVVAEARRFAVDELGLPDNASYTTYSDIGRDYVVWNVFATPEFSVQPKAWCFPVAGCVNYRGYFSREAAQREAGRLEARGFDVAVGGVTAYSTLGRFDDPILSSMLRWDDAELVATLFHELAHQVLYVKDDSAFNESFATAVEEAGIRRWLGARNDADALAAYNDARRLRRDLMALVAAVRDALQAIYESDLSDDDKRREKRARLDALAADAARLMQAAGREPSGWLTGELNNARLVSMTLYEGRLPAFRALLAECDGAFACFYDAAARLADLDAAQRSERLDALAGSESMSP